MRRFAKPLVLVLLVSTLADVAVASVPDQMGDLLVLRSWTRGLVERGLTACYWPSAADPCAGSAIDYPPLLPYILWAGGRLLFAVAPRVLTNDRALDVVLRALMSLANLAIAGVLFVFMRRRAGDGTAAVVAALFALNPAVIFASAYWGQTDSLCALSLVFALVLRGEGRPGLGWAALTLACLVKPLAWQFVPLFVVAEWRRGGATGLLVGAAVSLGTGALALVPFLVSGRGVAILTALVTQLDVMPYATVNAHNLWWLLTQGLPWTRADTRVAGLVTLETVGLALLVAFDLAILVHFMRSPEPRALERAAASVAFGGFILSTHMHENHLFLVLPVLLLAVGDIPRGRRLFVLVSAAFLVNMALHDPLLNALARPLALGPRVLLPRSASVDAGALEALRSQGYAALAEQIRGEASVLWAGLTLLDSQILVLSFAAWIAWVCGRWPRRWKRVATGAALFVVVTGLPFMAHVVAAPRAIGD